MRFNQVLHPEIIMDKRGEKVVRKLYRDWMSLITIEKFDRNGPTFQLNLPKDPKLMEQLQILESDTILAKHVCLAKKFLGEKEKKIYHFGKALAQDLSGIHKNIPLDLLPNRFVGYVSFPPETLYDDTGWCEGGYVAILPFDESCINEEPNAKNERVIWISYISKKSKTDDLGPVVALLFPLTSTKIETLQEKEFMNDYSMDGVSNSVTTPSLEAQAQRNLVYRALLNSLIFLTCKNVNFELSKPAVQRGLSNKEILRRGEVINECTLPVTFVNRSYHGIQYSKDSTQVRSHLRFQRCGPAYSQVELITVKGHERHFKNEV